MPPPTGMSVVAIASVAAFVPLCPDPSEIAGEAAVLVACESEEQEARATVPKVAIPARVTAPRRVRGSIEVMVGLPPGLTGAVTVCRESVFRLRVRHRFGAVPDSPQDHRL